jgi:hypothetical protein
MIEQRHDALHFRFPEIHPDAELTIGFQRTLRIPDDGRTYPLPAGLGRFPLRHVDDFSMTVPRKWSTHGGVMLPMYQSEAMWINFSSQYLVKHAHAWPFAVKIAAGKVDAVTGKKWKKGIFRTKQNYMVVPGQPWLDGFCVEKGLIRQFVAMPMGAGYTAEEQITGSAEHGGIQICVYPMKREAFMARFPERREDASVYSYALSDMLPCAAPQSAEMGLAPGGMMKQDISRDPYTFSDWGRETSSQCFVHIANSLVWRAVTGQNPPTVPPTSKEYQHLGIPWFDYYDDGLEALEGSSTLAELKSVLQMGGLKGDVPLPDNESVDVDRIIDLSGGKRVKEGI